MSFESICISKNEVYIHLMPYEPFSTVQFIDHLTDIERERYFTFKSESRKMEFIATRLLRHNIFGFSHIHYSETGAPYIEDEGFISISHAPGIVGLATCKKFNIGLDIEIIRDKAALVHDKFLSFREKGMFDCSSALEMTKLWSAKETLYKLSQRKKLIFKEELLINHLTEDTFNCTIVQPDENLTVELSSVLFRNFVVTFNHTPCTIAIP